MQTHKLRLHHIDLLRGVIIILMILDHAMVYCSDYFVTDPMAVPGTDTKVFFSRFVSHFCAPLFVFLAGLGAALTERRFDNNRQFALSLITRGVVLIILEFTLVSWSWSFNPAYPMLYAQVIWAIGWGFVCLGLLRLVNTKIILLAGLVIVFGHNLLDTVQTQAGTWPHYLWSVLHQKNVLALPFDFKVRTTYPILPIVGLMSLAYMAGRHYISQGFSSRTEKHALWLGIACLIGYTLLRLSNAYGDPGQFAPQASPLLTLMALLNPSKYPLSLQFMLLTVGVGLILLYAFAQVKPTFSQYFLQVLGKTSMFSYIAHLYLLHLISWLLIPVLGFKISDMTYGETLIGLPPGFGLSYSATLALAASVVILTCALAYKYLAWKQVHKNNLIAKYI